jgi:hypothetical protein
MVGGREETVVSEGTQTYRKGHSLLAFIIDHFFLLKRLAHLFQPSQQQVFLLTIKRCHLFI